MDCRMYLLVRFLFLCGLGLRGVVIYGVEVSVAKGDLQFMSRRTVDSNGGARG